jgi:hypothetical protein
MNPSQWIVRVCSDRRAAGLDSGAPAAEAIPRTDWLGPGAGDGFGEAVADGMAIQRTKVSRA